MLKKTITYTDYNGTKRTEDFYFNLNTSELAEMQFGTTGGYAEMLQKRVNANDQTIIIKTFKELVLKAYGEKSEDGRRFIKSDEISQAFAQTEAYNILFMELLSDENAALEFAKGIVPADMAKQIGVSAPIAFPETTN